jgi:hypothetical protein
MLGVFRGKEKPTNRRLLALEPPSRSSNGNRLFCGHGEYTRNGLRDPSCIDKDDIDVGLSYKGSGSYECVCAIEVRETGVLEKGERNGEWYNRWVERAVDVHGISFDFKASNELVFKLCCQSAFLRLGHNEPR